PWLRLQYSYPICNPHFDSTVLILSAPSEPSGASWHTRHPAQLPGSPLRTRSPSRRLPGTYVEPRELAVLQHWTEGSTDARLDDRYPHRLEPGCLRPTVVSQRRNSLSL